MNSYFLSICTAILLPISLIASIGNNPAIAASSQPQLTNTQPSDRLISDASPTEPVEKIKFYCGTSYDARLNKRVPTAIAYKNSQKYALVQWVKSIGTYWTPERRCQEFVRGMEAATNADIKYIISGKMNGEQVICVAAKVDGDCQYFLMHTEPGERSLEILNKLQNMFYDLGLMVEQ